MKIPGVLPAGKLRCGFLAQPGPAAWHRSTGAGWVSPGVGTALSPLTAPTPRVSGPSSPPAPSAPPWLPATLKFPRRTKQKREEKAFHHRSREPTYKNLTLPLPRLTRSLGGIWARSVRAAGGGTGRRAAQPNNPGLPGKPSPWESAPKSANPRLTFPRARAPAPGVSSATSK